MLVFCSGRMAEWKKRAVNAAVQLESRLDELKFRLRKRAGAFRNVQLLPFRGFGNSERLIVKGRVLKEIKLRPSLETDGLWRNLLATYRRFNTLEVPGVRVAARLGKCSAEAVTDGEGYFEVELRVDLAGAKELWHAVEVELPGQKRPVKICSEVLVPTKRAEFGVISDIDDTVVRSQVQNLSRLAYAVFMQNARARVVVPGVPEFYRGLHLGKGLEEVNPIFYVSSGPWNLYDLLVEFLELNNIPKGPIFLQDYGFEKGKFFAATHRAHKGAQIRRILEMYPELPFILIGDSGQHDPEVYLEALEQAPNRIKAIYIRNVSDTARGEQVAELAKEARRHGGALFFFGDVSEAVEHARQSGLIKG